MSITSEQTASPHAPDLAPAGVIVRGVSPCRLRGERRVPRVHSEVPQDGGSHDDVPDVYIQVLKYDLEVNELNKYKYFKKYGWLCK